MRSVRPPRPVAARVRLGTSSGKRREETGEPKAKALSETELQRLLVAVNPSGNSSSSYLHRPGCASPRRSRSGGATSTSASVACTSVGASGATTPTPRDRSTPAVPCRFRPPWRATSGAPVKAPQTTRSCSHTRAIRSSGQRRSGPSGRGKTRGHRVAGRACTVCATHTRASSSRAARAQSRCNACSATTPPRSRSRCTCTYCRTISPTRSTSTSCYRSKGSTRGHHDPRERARCPRTCPQANPHSCGEALTGRKRARPPRELKIRFSSGSVGSIPTFGIAWSAGPPAPILVNFTISPQHPVAGQLFGGLAIVNRSTWGTLSSINVMLRSQASCCLRENRSSSRPPGRGDRWSSVAGRSPLALSENGCVFGAAITVAMSTSGT
jgi:hypothetical protein